MASIARIYGVYLIHMERPVNESRPAQHYIGWSPSVFERLGTHRRGQGARILAACNERGISYRIARLWKGQGRDFERQLKRRKNASKLCPICNGDAARRYPVTQAPKAFSIMPDGTRCPF